MLNELFLARMKEYLNDEFDEFLASYSNENVRAFTLNNNLISNAEFESIIDLNIKKIPYVHNGYYLLDKDVKLGFHPLHHAGAFYMQDPSAMCVVESVDIPSDYLVLDLCAAPGGKTIQLAQKVCDGLVISNEIDFKRAKALYSNVERMGLSNVIVTNNAPSDFLAHFENTFDMILIDAPCSGEGMFRKYPESQELWSLENVDVCHKRDIEIVDVAHKLLKKGGILVYSTCTFAKEENEDIVSYLLEKYNYTQLEKRIKNKIGEGNKDDKSYKPAPIYDNGSSFVSKHTDEKLLGIMSTESKMINSVLNGMCYYTIDNVVMNFKKFFETLHIKNLDKDLNNAIDIVKDKIVDSWNNIVKFIKEIPNDEEGLKIISDVQKKFFVESMRIRINYIFNLYL